MKVPVSNFSFGDPTSIDVGLIVDYFNLEIPRGEGETFAPEHFRYLGVHRVNEEDTMFWSVEGEDICAIVNEHGDSFSISMEYLPGAHVDA